MNPRIDGGILEAEDRPTVGADGLPDDMWIRSGLVVGGIADVVTAAGGRPWFCCDEDIQDEGLIDVEMPKPIARNDGRAGIPRTFC